MLYNISVKEKFNISVFNIKFVRYDLIQQVVLWQQLSKKKSLSKTKSIAEVSGSTRKIYRQKGSGRARHGTIKSSCFVGGGVSFGPNTSKNYSYKINNKIFIIALKHAISVKYKTNSLFVYKRHTYYPSSNTISIFNDIHFNINNSLFVDRFYLPSSKRSYNINNLYYIDYSNLNILNILKYGKIFFSSHSFKNILSKLV